MENIFELLSSGSFIVWFAVVFVSIVVLLVFAWFSFLLYITFSFRNTKLTDKDFDGNLMRAINNQLYKDTYFGN